MKFKRAFLVEAGRFEVMEIEENINPNEVMVRIASCGMCNFDLNFWNGRLNFYGFPHRLGHEFAGTIVEVGEAVTNYKIGDKVSVLMRGFGGYSEYRAVVADRLQRLADDIDPKYALGEPQKCIMTVLRAIRPEAGDYGVVLGCGPMGLWTIMGLKGNYLGGLIAIDIDDEKLALAKKYGATHVINPQKEDVIGRLAEITNGHM
ncbi:MAG: alcohol dehydrogenase catalytic domain-containing protein, partial [Lachnospiraceae bacterium]|nr:alcohol dehydrogenase catalytic domain-containing protein [Lachnospiraceae bacterium]